MQSAPSLKVRTYGKTYKENGGKTVAQVFVDKMQCITSVDSTDDIYMIIFRGNTTAPFESNVGVHGPGNFWNGMDASGPPRDQDILQALFRPDAVYVVMLIEQDTDRDIDDTALGLWKHFTDVQWKAVMLSQTLARLPTNQEPQMTAAAAAIVNTFLGAADATIRFPKDPDDIIGPPQRLVIVPGKKPMLEFKEKGGTGHYKVTFKVK
jgi:hypothetical protein